MNCFPFILSIFFFATWWPVVSSSVAIPQQLATSTTATTTRMIDHVPLRGGSSQLIMDRSKEAALTPTTELQNSDFSRQACRSLYISVAMLTTTNLLLNQLRPDKFISWQMKVPRILWDGTIISLSLLTAIIPSSSMLRYLLIILLIPTALVDLFVWAPMFAMFGSFDTTRLVVVFQSMVLGLFYLITSLQTMSSLSHDQFLEMERLRRIQIMEQER